MSEPMPRSDTSDAGAAVAGTSIERSGGTPSGLWHHAVEQAATAVQAAKWVGNRRVRKIVSLSRGDARHEQLVDAKYRIEAEARVPRGMAPQKELQPCGWVRRERGVFADS